MNNKIYQIGDTFTDNVNGQNIIVVKDKENVRSYCELCYYLCNGKRDKDDSNCYGSNCATDKFHFEINTK